jgi:hypothetical protein
MEEFLTTVLSKIPYEELPRAKIELPKRQHRGDYEDPDYPLQTHPEFFRGRRFGKPTAVLGLDGSSQRWRGSDKQGRREPCE